MITKVFWLVLLYSALALSPALAAEAQPATSPATPQTETFSVWIQQMKEQARGPFSGIRWYCADGVVLDPLPAACETHGGGFQHGQWSERTRQIRTAGYPIANLLADLKPEAVTGPGVDPDFLSILLLEKFLIASDDGWILRKAQFYRGAFQDYNERDGAKAILLALLADQNGSDFAVQREAVRLLPHGAETAAITALRGMAVTIVDRDAQFQILRSKIHNMPEAADAQRVREYAVGPQGQPALQEDYAALAQMIDQVNARSTLPDAFRSLSRGIRKPELAQRFRSLADELDSRRDAESQFRLGTDALVLIREQLPQLAPSKLRLAALDASVSAEISVFIASRAVLQTLPGATRAQRLVWLRTAARSVYGIGLLTTRELAQIEQSLATLAPERVRLEIYRSELQELGRAAAWPEHRLGYHFGNAMDRLTPIEPLAAGYVADRLRGSTMLFYSNVLETLTRDADRLSDTRHSLFGQEISGLRRLNPGMARGVLRTSADIRPTELLAPVAIYLVPETTADLPAVAGILTAAEGNALSHVQLLARNLGIPNVVVGRPLLLTLEAYRGRSIVVTASAGGVVRIEEDSPDWDSLLGIAKGNLAEPIFVNLAKLDLTRTELVPTTRLRAADSGRIAGPKAAQVGELTHAFPGRVSLGLAIPFGLYRAVLDRPVVPGQTSSKQNPNQTMFEWLKAQYADLAVRKDLDPEYYGRRLPVVLAFVRQWLLRVDLGPQFRERLRNDMHDLFGMEGTYGVFVRSDTNVEDLPGFTGAGLNLTIPNVVHLDAVIAAIKQVWASPSTERAFGWRQGLMDLPEHVYASVLLHRSLPNEKSGVLVATNLDTGDRDEITVVTNTGVSGGVDGQAAETLRISLKTGAVRLLASDTSRTKRVLSEEGGARQVPSDAPEYVLTPDEIKQLLEFMRAFPKDYPGLQDVEGQPAPADIEFGFVNGHLMLLQIRPFVQSALASRNQYLLDLDAGLRKTRNKNVDLHAIPASSLSGPV